ncbi:hypothetical protein LTR48_004010 [Friedmanniomyces endolithicus]|uniref:Uncharacterized protein n=1 Tax=Rachicladosporium monterosium TaxID=1507873 RepID=A0ABR0LFF4_9PEZI|nr:hypothetical protein LTR29_016690 [Friedmanniomyces endolithicus]KAK1092614.1 hypothetical protein LTR48_004010 [Friedmanniomyces endolithicus]KAK5147951.1 hypothetical protein LTR32_000701 [Rachicladosporium monterosium]
MGIDAGFDMIPRLTRGAVDKNDWSSFIRQVREYYEKDQRVDVRPNYLLFTTGENPMLPFEGHKFLRFSSKISGSHAASTNTNSYIRTVTRIATAHFGSRVRPWDESVDQNGHYSWTEVHETIGSYEQPDEDGPPMSVAEFVFDTNPVEELDSTLYETRSIPGKGRGLVARFNIPQGSRILVETPLIVRETCLQSLSNP